MNPKTTKEWIDVIESIRTLSHQVEQKNYLLLDYEHKIDHIHEGIANLHAMQVDYQEQTQRLDDKIDAMKDILSS